MARASTVSRYAALPSVQTLEKTVSRLKQNGIDVYVTENGAQAKEKILELLPAGAAVMNMTSVTLDTIGIAQEILESQRYFSVRNRLISMDRSKELEEMQQLGAAPPWVVGSVHAITEDGTVMIASQTGSQLPAYAYGASHVIWAAGAQKIVRGIDDGLKRIHEYCLPLESERARKAYKVPGSAVNKVLMVNKEIQPGRITLILIKEVIGF